MSEEQHDWFGDPEGYRAFSAAHPPPQFNPHWCIEHWMPCPVEGKNGMLATVLLMTEAFSLLPEGVTSPSAMNSWWANQTRPACCQLGDEKMAHLWRFVDYVSDDSLVCLAPPHPAFTVRKRSSGRHACFYPKDHPGVHDWQEKPKSIYDYDIEGL